MPIFKKAAIALGYLSLVLTSLAVLPDPSGWFTSPFYVHTDEPKKTFLIPPGNISLLVRDGHSCRIEGRYLLVPAVLETTLDVFEIKAQFPRIQILSKIEEREKRGISETLEIKPSYDRQGNENISTSTLPANIIVPLKDISTRKPVSIFIGNGNQSIEVWFVGNLLNRFLSLLPVEVWWVMERKSDFLLYIISAIILSITLFSHRPNILAGAFANIFVISACMAGLSENYIVSRLLWAVLLFSCVPLRLPGRFVIQKDGRRWGHASGALVDTVDGVSAAFMALTFSTIVFAFYLAVTSAGTFKWGPFEERDFLSALSFGAGGLLEDLALGPQLLAGGQTPGGFLYGILSAVAKVSDDPGSFASFNRSLHVGALIILTIAAVRYFGWLAGAYVALLFAGGEIVLANSAWPIHPSMSVALYFLFMFSFVEYYVYGKRAFLYISFALLSLLIQFHFSYVAVIPCIIILLMKARGQERPSTILLGLCLFMIPFGPYLIHEFRHDWNNIYEIFSAPRFNPAYVPVVGGRDKPLLKIFLSWYSWATPSESLSQVLSFAARSLVFLGLGAGIATVFFAESGKEKVFRRANEAVLILFSVPFCIILFSGFGYYHRHTIAFVFASFLLPAVFLSCVFRSIPKARLIGGLMAGSLALLEVWWTVGQSSYFADKSMRHGEWAVDFNKRQALMRRLVTEYGITPDVYAEKVFIWWLGWAADPVLYRRVYEANDSKIENRLPLKANQTLFVFCGGNPSGPLLRYFQFEKVTSFDCFNLYVGTTNSLPNNIGNTVNRTGVLGRKWGKDGFLRESGAGSINNAVVDKLKAEFGGGRIRADLEVRFDENNGIAKWLMSSSHLNGYYQEIKRLWHPALEFVNVKEGTRRKVPLSGSPLGGWFEKTPVRGTVEVGGKRDEWCIFFKADGYFDQSSMKEPEIAEHVWEIGGRKDTCDRFLAGQR